MTTSPAVQREAAVGALRAVLRRYQDDPFRQLETNLVLGDLILDPQSYAVTKAGKRITLTRLEFRILYLLAMNPGRVIPYSRLVEYAWGYDSGDASLLKTHICHIRQTLNLPARPESGIYAMPGVGRGLAAA